MGLIYFGETVEIDRDYEVSILRRDFEAQRVEIITWLVDNFGYDEDSGLWNMWECGDEDKGGRSYFFFHHERDAAAFKLAWI